MTGLKWDLLSGYYCRDKVSSRAYLPALVLLRRYRHAVKLAGCHGLPGGVLGLHGHGIPNSQQHNLAP